MDGLVIRANGKKIIHFPTNELLDTATCRSEKQSHFSISVKGGIMIEIAGLVVSGIGLVNDLISRYKDLAKWAEVDLLVDSQWLSLALSMKQIDGRSEDFVWANERRVPTRELQGTSNVVIAFNQEKKTKYRICRGRADDRLILMKKKVISPLIN